MAIFNKKTETQQPTALASAMADAGVNSKTVVVRNVLDVLPTLDRRSHVAALRSLCGAVQFTMINTADWIVRRQLAAQASDMPTLDERNGADEFTRGQDEIDQIAREFGHDPQQSPEDKLKQYSHLYYGLVNEIRQLNPQPFERPKGIRDVLAEYSPRGATLDAVTLKLLEAAEMEPGEFDRARDDLRTRKAREMAARKPQILELLELNADCNPLTDVFTELPVHTQLRLATAAWKGVYFSRKSLVGYIATSGKVDDIAAVKAMQSDLEILAKWCEDFEARNKDVLDLLPEAGITVYGIDDAKDDVKKPRQQ